MGKFADLGRLFVLEAESTLARADARRAVEAWYESEGWDKPAARHVARALRAVGAKDCDVRTPDGRHVDGWRGIRLRVGSDTAPSLTAPTVPKHVPRCGECCKHFCPTCGRAVRVLR